MDKVEKLYRNFGVLADAKDKIIEHEKEFMEIVEAVKGSSQEKRLASQFIARFFKHFPHLIDQAIDAQLDLCEDDDVSIRKQAIKDLPSLCRNNPEHLLKIADVLAQLLQADDASELSTVHNSLMTLFKIDTKGTLRGLFSQILSGEDMVREKAIKFLASKLKSLGDVVMNREAEECFLEECKKALQDVTATEFVTFMQMLSGLKLAKTVSGQQHLVDIVAEQAELDKPFDPADSEMVDRLMQCLRHVLPYFSCMVHSTRFVLYICRNVLPALSQLKSGATDGSDTSLELVKLLAELCSSFGSEEATADVVRLLFDKLLEYMPLPQPAAPAPAAHENTENGGSGDGAGVAAAVPADPRLEFSYVECLMFAFHQMGRRHPQFLTDEANAELLKDFRLRLQYFARGIQGYIKKLRESLQGKKAEELKTEENKLKVVALKTTSNINTLIRDLFHNPPSYKSNVTLSWKPVVTSPTAKVTPTKRAASQISENTETTTTTGAKRPHHTPITFDEDGRGGKTAGKGVKRVTGPPVTPVQKGDRIMYQPPGGKYSTKVKNFAAPQGGAGMGQQRGGGGGGARRGFRRGGDSSYGGGGRGRGGARGNWFH